MLSGAWTKLTDLEIDQFLATPEFGELATSRTLPDQEEAVPELVEETEGGEINIGNEGNIEGIETDPNLSDVNNEAYNHFYINDFTQDVFY